MYDTNFLCGVTGDVAEISSPNKAKIHFELHGVWQTAFLIAHRFYKNGKLLPDNQNLDEFLRIGHKVKFSCHINNNHFESGECKWYITSCWQHIESEHEVIMLSGMMNVAGTVTDLWKRHGSLVITDMTGTDHKVHFLGSRVYLFGKKFPASKPLSSQLQIDDKVYFDAIPCFAEENNQNCNWFATCVHNGKKPELFLYKDFSKIETVDIDDENKILNQFIESFKGDDKSIRDETPTNYIDFLIDGLNMNVDNSSANVDVSPTHSSYQESVVPEYHSTSNIFETVLEQIATSDEGEEISEVSSISETEFFNEDSNPKVEPDRINAQMLQNIKPLINNPQAVFAKSEGIILDIINEEYGVILGEFQRNEFQNILFHRSNAFLLKMSLAYSKLPEIFIEGDRVRFIAVKAPEQFVCDWIATQVSVACHDSEEQDLLEDDDSDDQFE